MSKFKSHLFGRHRINTARESQHRPILKKLEVPAVIHPMAEIRLLNK